MLDTVEVMHGSPLKFYISMKQKQGCKMTVYMSLTDTSDVRVYSWKFKLPKSIVEEANVLINNK